MNCAIIGSGNIGLDLYFKCKKLKFIENISIFGRSNKSKGALFCKKNKIQYYSGGIKDLMSNISNVQIVFDATSAVYSYVVAKELGHLLHNKYYLNLTPSKIGSYFVPYGLKMKIPNKINLITCGGQSSIPVILEIKKLLKNKIKYVELVSSISSSSAGEATRENIDEYLVNTESAISKVAGIKNNKVILNLNPANPPVNMMNSLFFELKNKLTLKNYKEIAKAIFNINKKIKKYIPQYNIKFFQNKNSKLFRLTIRVVGQGDYLPSYAGNLDVITSAAVRVAYLIKYEK